MDRRNFLKTTSCAGLTCLMPTAWGLSKAQAQEAAATTYSGTYWIFLHAAGGWDPTHLCDPKGRTNEDDREAMGRFSRDDIRTAGNLRYAPLGEGGTALDTFFQRHYQRLLVINGIDTGTNGHDQGTRGTWSGSTGEGLPAIGALIAATHGPNVPMPLIGGGGYLNAQGTARIVRLGEASLLKNLAFPAKPDPPDSGNYFGHEGMPALIQQAQAARLARERASQQLPTVQRSQNELFLARSATNNLKLVAETLPGGDQLSDNELERQIQIALAAYRAGVSVGVSLSRGGFDTHGNHDGDHLPRLIDLCNAADFAMEEAERLGVADKVCIVFGSDFGRTPGYNSGNGKDHWPVTSMMMMGPGIPGNTVVGATDERHNLLLVDPTTLQPTGRPDEAQGVRLGIAEVHRSLRKLAGVGPEFAAAFPLGGQDLPLFRNA